jgi:hypothetical protein
MLSLSTIRHGSRARTVKDGCLRRLLNCTSTASGIVIGSPRAVSTTLAIRQEILSCKADNTHEDNDLEITLFK